MLETDYLIIGSGAVGMAFADVLLAETDANLVIVDRFAKPGGHWNVAYPFVTLHQPSQFYGVSSKELSKGSRDQVGLNQGLYELASGTEVLAYFEELMRQTFLPSGRVKYFPMCEYQGEGRFTSLLSGEVHQVAVRKKIVDCTYLKTSVPATHTPNFEVAAGVNFIPPNELPTLKRAPAGFVIIGGGKTGIDACLWLLEQGVDPDRISWIVSRDAWLINRAKVQPTEEFFEQTMGAIASQMEAIVEADSLAEVFDRLEADGVWLRLDPEVRPTMFHAATVSEAEIDQLRRIKRVIRLGRLKRIESQKLILEQGRIPTSPDHVHVDCSASAISNLASKRVFDGNLITPQTVRPYQPVFSAAFIAHVEASYPNEKVKNKLCQVVPLPNSDTDWVPMMAAQMVNQITWSQDQDLKDWLYHNRLDGMSAMVRDRDREDPQKTAIMQRIRAASLPAMAKLQQFMQELSTPPTTPMSQPQFQVKRSLFLQHRLVETPAEDLSLSPGEILVAVEQFAYTANNITYAVAGDTIGYWKFFPPVGPDPDGWGVIPVWGFGKVIESQAEGVEVGERLFGYFPPAKALKMRPVGIKPHGFMKGRPIGRNCQRPTTAIPGWPTKRAMIRPLTRSACCCRPCC
jgi:hypothetical protein